MKMCGRNSKHPCCNCYKRQSNNWEGRPGVGYLRYFTS